MQVKKIKKRLCKYNNGTVEQMRIYKYTLGRLCFGAEIFGVHVNTYKMTKTINAI